MTRKEIEDKIMYLQNDQNRGYGGDSYFMANFYESEIAKLEAQLSGHTIDWPVSKPVQNWDEPEPEIEVVEYKWTIDWTKLAWAGLLTSILYLALNLVR